MEIVWSESARDDLEKILHYIDENWGSAVTLNFIEKLKHLLHLILLNPHTFQQSSEKKGLRRAVLTKQNTIYFQITDEFIQIIRIFDTRQHPQKKEL